MSTTERGDARELHLKRAGRHTALAQRALGPATVQGDLAVRECWDELNRVATALHGAGVPVNAGGLPPSDPMGIGSMSKIERARPEGEALLAALEALLPVAEALDKARGDWAGDMAATHLGETPGTNYAEMIQELHLKLRQELRGATGSGLE